MKRQVPQGEGIEEELTRIRVEYAHRAVNTEMHAHYSMFNESTLLLLHGLERNLLSMLRRHGMTKLGEICALDIGCGSGNQLQRLISYGANPTRLAGIDLLSQRIEEARKVQPLIDWRVGSAHQLPYADASFDLVMFFVVFSSILHPVLREQIAAEAWRVLKPGGLILCYDFVYGNPQNRAVQGVPRRQIQQIFRRPGAQFVFRRLTLAPPIARRLAPRNRWLADTLEQSTILNTHLLSAISVPTTGG